MRGNGADKTYAVWVHNCPQLAKSANLLRERFKTLTTKTVAVVDEPIHVAVVKNANTSVDHGRFASGWSESIPAKVRGQIQRVFAIDTIDWAKKNLDLEFPTHGRDQGVPGQYHASHAEIQAIMHNKNAVQIGLSTKSGKMCDSCVAFFTKYTKNRAGNGGQKNITVTTDKFIYKFDDSGVTPTPIAR